MITNRIFDRWKKGDRFHLLFMNGSNTEDIFIGNYEDCLKAACRRYDLDKLPENFFLVDITEDFIDEITNAMIKDGSGWNPAYAH